MRDTYTAKEIATALGITLQAWNKRARKESVLRLPQRSQGGGKLYPFASLPEDVQESIRKHEEKEILENAVVPYTLPAPKIEARPLKDWQRDVRDARLVILEAVEQLSFPLGGILKAEQEFAERAKSGQLADRLLDCVVKANARSGKNRALTAATLRLWRRIRKNEGPDGLAPKAASVPVEVQYPAWLLPFLEAYQLPGKPSVSFIYKRLKDGLKLPSLRTVERKIAALGAVERNTGRMGGKDLKKLKAFVRRDVANMLPSDIYSADGTVADMYAIKPENGTLFRPEITTVIDVATRALVGLSVGLSENALDVTAALRMAVKNFGIPAMFYADNGPGYKNKFLENELLGVLARLGISSQHSIPRSSQSRGVIESLQKLWNREARVYGCYCGRDMDREAAERFLKKANKELKETGATTCAPSLTQFVQMIARCADVYNNTPHTFLPTIFDSETGKKRHQTPLERWADLAPKTEFFFPSEWELKDMLRPQIQRMVKRCELNVFGQKYFSVELEPFEGKRVAVGIDIHDPATVQVRDLKGTYLCEATFEGNKRAYYPQPYIEKKRDERAARRTKLLDKKYAEIQSERNGIAGELTASPAKKTLTMTPQQEAIQAELTQALTAAPETIALEAPTAQPMPSNVTPLRPAPRAAERSLIPTAPDEQFALALELEDKISLGLEVDTKLAVWLGGYQHSAAYKARRDMQELYACEK